MKKMTDEEIENFIRSNSDLFDSLANSIRCACCEKIIKKPFYNLGKDFNWAEGCEDCSRKL